jgi:hypothetical protein
MVRLKVTKGHAFHKLLEQFQFQYGAVKRGFGVCLSPSKEQFQFQYGAVKRQRKPPISGEKYHISIPIWCG